MCTIFASRANVAGRSATRSEKRVPTAISRSQPSTARFDAWLPCMPIMPVESGSSPGMEPPPIRVMATGASSFLAKARNSSCALLLVTPPPQMSMGFFDWAIISTRMSTSSLSGSNSRRLDECARRSRPASEPVVPCWSRGRNSYSHFWLVTSFRISMSTGPGRPERASAKASRTVSASSSTLLTRNVDFVMGIMMPMTSASWNASLPSWFALTLQVIATTGDESR